jgi:hypothetical protein
MVMGMSFGRVQSFALLAVALVAPAVHHRELGDAALRARDVLAPYVTESDQSDSVT